MKRHRDYVVTLQTKALQNTHATTSTMCNCNQFFLDIQIKPYINKSFETLQPYSLFVNDRAVSHSKLFEHNMVDAPEIFEIAYRPCQKYLFQFSWTSVNCEHFRYLFSLICALVPKKFNLVEQIVRHISAIVMKRNLY